MTELLITNKILFGKSLVSKCLISKYIDSTYYLLLNIYFHDIYSTMLDLIHSHPLSIILTMDTYYMLHPFYEQRLQCSSYSFLFLNPCWIVIRIVFIVLFSCIFFGANLSCYTLSWKQLDSRVVSSSSREYIVFYHKDSLEFTCNIFNQSDESYHVSTS